MDEEELLRLIAANPGTQLSDLEELTSLSRRTIQRRLRSLIDAGRVERLGAGRSTKYQVSVDESKATAQGSALQLTDDGVRARRLVQRPLTEREPVSYNHDFLESYRPNQDFYLSEVTRSKLKQIGTSDPRKLPAGTYARRVLDRLLIDLSWNSSRLEGNTYSLLETERLLNAGVESSERDPRETQMILNHKAAIEFLVDGADAIDFDRLTILNLHALLADNLLATSTNAGRVRRAPVRISGSVYEPLQNPHRIDELLDEILEKTSAIKDPFEQAFFFLVHVPYLQPFIDVNKRVSRLGANIPMIRANLSPLSFIDVRPIQYAEAMLAVYENNEVALLRELFAWTYERSAKRYSAIRDSLGEPDAIKLRYRQELKEFVARVIRHQWSRGETERELDGVATSLPAPDVSRFVEAVLEELDNLHEGNFARYRVKPSEYRAWAEAWD